MKNIFLYTAIVAWLLLMLGCQSDSGTLENRDSQNEYKFHFEFIKLDTANILKYFDPNMLNKLSTFSESELSGVFILEIQNIRLDSMLVPCNYVRGFPIYYSSKTECFKAIKDTVPISVDIPSNLTSNTVKLLKNEKRYFLTYLSLSENISKIEYFFYSYDSNKKQNTRFKVILKEQNQSLFDMTKY